MVTKQKSHQLPLNLQQLATATVSLPIFGFIFCITWSYLHNFENSTYTHCEVDNFAPSISAAIGSFVPQKYVWQTSIAIHIAPRFLFVSCYNALYHQRLTLTSKTKLIIRFNTFIGVVEILALLGLTVVSSQEQFTIHKTCFGTFIAAALCYMTSCNYLYRRCGFKPQNQSEFMSRDLKKILVLFNLILIPLLLYFYHRHNEYCEPYIYSWFCICEYAIVLINMGFHFLAHVDFSDTTVLIPSRQRRASYAPLKEIA